MPNITREWLTVKQAAEYLQVSTATITRWIREGTLAASQVGSTYRIAAATIERMLEAGAK
jgi:excisionase family DNA binding protein